MPGQFWEDWATEQGLDWDEVASIHVFRDDFGWNTSVETGEGEFIEFPGVLSDEEAEEYIWDDLYLWAAEYEVDFDREVYYSDA